MMREQDPHLWMEQQQRRHEATIVMIRALCNGIFATLFFFVFLYFLIRFVSLFPSKLEVLPNISLCEQENGTGT